MNEVSAQPSSNTLASPAQSISEGRVAGFSVHLENFDGPFDLLLQLI
jgi:segregation and condensation protein A